MSPRDSTLTRGLATASLVLACVFGSPAVGSGKGVGSPDSPAPAAPAERTLEFGRFGTVHLYGNPATAKQVVLFASGDGGWELGVVDMARDLASLDALVVGIDVVHFLHQIDGDTGPCAYPAADFEELAQFVEKQLGFAQYVTPVLAGYSSGATLVYAVQVQAPPATFRGAMSLGFCPDLWTVKPFCKGHGLEFRRNPKEKGVLFAPSDRLETPWIVFQGSIDQVCDPQSTAGFVARVPHGELVSLPKVGHGFSVPRHWLPQMREAFARLVEQDARADPPAAVATPADTPAAGPSGRAAARPAAGRGFCYRRSRRYDREDDARGGAVGGRRLGGSRQGDRRGTRAHRGSRPSAGTRCSTTGGLRTPEGAAADLARILEHYVPAWGRDRVLSGRLFLRRRCLAVPRLTAAGALARAGRSGDLDCAVDDRTVRISRR